MDKWKKKKRLDWGKVEEIEWKKRKWMKGKWKKTIKYCFICLISINSCLNAKVGPIPVKSFTEVSVLLACNFYELSLIDWNGITTCQHLINTSLNICAALLEFKSIIPFNISNYHFFKLYFTCHQSTIFKFLIIFAF